MFPKGHRKLRDRFDLVYDPEGHGNLRVALTSFMTQKVKVNIEVALI